MDCLGDDPLLMQYVRQYTFQKTVLLFVQEGSSQQATSCSSLPVVITSNKEQVIKYNISGYVPSHSSFHKSLENKKHQKLQVLLCV